MKMDRGTKNAAYTQLQAKSILYSAESIYGQNENYCNKLIFFFPGNSLLLSECGVNTRHESYKRI
jgi:hypothetical protein